MKKKIYAPQGHDSCGQRNAGDGVEVGKMGKHKVNRGKDHDEVGCFDWFAIWGHSIMDLLKGFTTCNHIDYAHTQLHH